jgi:hypothetical protein
VPGAAFAPIGSATRWVFTVIVSLMGLGFVTAVAASTAAVIRSEHSPSHEPDGHADGDRRRRLRRHHPAILAALEELDPAVASGADAAQSVFSLLLDVRRQLRALRFARSPARQLPDA